MINSNTVFNISGGDDLQTSESTNWVLIENNEASLMQIRLFNTTGVPWSTDIIIRNNTMLFDPASTTRSQAFWFETVSQHVDGITIQDNIFGFPRYTWSGWPAKVINYSETYNGHVFFDGDDRRDYEWGAFSLDATDIKAWSPTVDGGVDKPDASFVDFANGDFTLNSDSPFYQASSVAGVDIGCDIAALNTAIAGVV